MHRDQQISKRYSQAFKQKVVSEIETGQITIAQARRLYDIRGGCTIQKWIKALGKNHLLNKVVRIQMPDEIDRVKTLQQEKQQLESALAQAHLQLLRLEKTIELAGQAYGADLKKKFDTKASVR